MPIPADVKFAGGHQAGGHGKDAPAKPKRSAVPFPRFNAVVGYSVVCLLLLAIALESFSYVALKIHDRYTAAREMRRFGAIPCRGIGDANCRPREPIDLITASPVFDGQPWAEQMWREFRLHNSKSEPYTPFLEWRNQEFKGQYLNVDATPVGEVRRTIAPPSSCADAKHISIWTLGGSVMFGYYTPDEFTIASYLAARLRAVDPCVEVVNFAVPAYNSNQELLQLVLKLKQGFHPDVVVFLDGYNDAWSGTYEGDPSADISLLSSRAVPGSRLQVLRHTNTVRLADILFRRMGMGMQSGGLSYPEVGQAELQRRVHATLDNYDANRRTIQSLAKTYGFGAYFFWQPSLLTGSKPLTPFERAVIEYQERSEFRALDSAVRATSEEAAKRARAGDDFIYLGALFDSHPEALYVDQAHLGPQGYRLLADAIADVLVRDCALCANGNAPQQ